MSNVAAHYTQIMQLLTKAAGDLHSPRASRLAIGWFVLHDDGADFAPVRQLRMATLRVFAGNDLNGPLALFHEYSLERCLRYGHTLIDDKSFRNRLPIPLGMKSSPRPELLQHHRRDLIMALGAALLDETDDSFSAPAVPPLFVAQDARRPLRPEYRNKSLIRQAKAMFGTENPTQAQLRQTFGALAVNFQGMTLYPHDIFLREENGSNRCPVTGAQAPLHRPRRDGDVHEQWVAMGGQWVPQLQHTIGAYAYLSDFRAREIANPAFEIFQQFGMLPPTGADVEVDAELLAAIQYQLEQLRTGAFAVLKSASVTSADSLEQVSNAEVSRINALFDRWPDITDKVLQELRAHLACNVGQHVDGVEGYPQLRITDAELLAGLRDPRAPIPVYDRMRQAFADSVYRGELTRTGKLRTEDIDQALSAPEFPLRMRDVMRIQVITVPGLFEPETMTWATETGRISLHGPESIPKGWRPRSSKKGMVAAKE